MADSGDTDAQSSIERSVKPYRGEYPTYDRLPVQGVARKEILRMMEAMRAREESRWADGFASGSVYNGDPEHIAFLNEVYALEFAGQSAARGSVAEHGEVRGRDRRDGRAACSVTSTVSVAR